MRSQMGGRARTVHVNTAVPWKLDPSRDTTGIMQDGYLAEGDCSRVVRLKMITTSDESLHDHTISGSLTTLRSTCWTVATKDNCGRVAGQAHPRAWFRTNALKQDTIGPCEAPAAEDLEWHTCMPVRSELCMESPLLMSW